ncbi:ABC transporter six-transmembrane domain-containing protein [Wielerella bovis]|uniref:ABC transporter six-transmembrane domain-containing protein n=1 Tax=Wielerella bovis TaxID=2917790 RepID=UPI0020189896|nr:ABC transporter six-transmembrane domain-containing protein [Wielerella bovis]MCG7656637.1 ABC transporter six-transmembrane domain-containing protein [Wielerella bovis]MCG7658862.1 ABC transporter six-transmembrane domain-containing protein [Wielerella bovis]ULJ69941.1 ABC transporter six-transmembrane domain-containing protein [Wielerella bovis]
MADAVHTLKQIAFAHRQKLLATFTLVALENVLFLLYPLVGSFAVNAVLAGKMGHALVYAAMVFVIWAVGSARRAVDTRAFVRIYADLAVKAIMNEKQKGTTSSASAHANLARQFVAFFEEHLPILITATFSIVGAVAMLLMIEFWSGVIALLILLTFLAILPRYMQKNDRLYFKLNNRLENEVNIIERSKNNELNKHYDLLSKIRIAISNREATSFLLIGVVLAILFGATLAILASKTVQAGHIYAVLTYLWGFAMSLDDMPRLVEKFSELKDIGKRVDV